MKPMDLEAKKGRFGPARPVPRLRGMGDLSQGAWYSKRRIQDRLQELIGSHGYQCLETPILEPTELFLRKSGGQLASRLYSFTDSGSNSVSLRPEFTAPIMRHYLEHAADVDLPVRWQYAGPVFRYEESWRTGGQFTQIGAELLGSDSVVADAEMVALAASIPTNLGIADYQVQLADLDLLNSVLDTTAISERARTFVIAAVPELRDGPSSIPRALAQADRLRLTSGGRETNQLSQGIEGLDDDQARKILQGMLHWSATEQMGQRDHNDVVDRMLRKVRSSDTEADLRIALGFASRLASIHGEPSSALESARSVIMDSGASTAALDRLEEFLDLVQGVPDVAGHLVINLGLLRGLAYYNGIVFEVGHPSQPASLGGGGRYDGLAGALGSPHPVPALGFAYNLESLMELSPLVGDESAAVEDEGEVVKPLVLVIGVAPGANANLIQASQELRHGGAVVELDVSQWDLEDALAHAGKLGMERVVVVEKDGRQTSHKVR